MKVKLMEVSIGKLECKVIFSTEFGVAPAVWRGSDPKTNYEYIVEFEIPGVLRWGNEIAKSDKDECSITMQNETVFLIGILESVDDDGYTVVRQGDNIFAIETDGNPISIGSFVVVKTDNLVIFDVYY